MTRDDALTITGMVVNNWPSSRWTTETIDAYAKAIEWMDAELATKAVILAVQSSEFYPKVSVLREFYGIEKRLAEPDPPIERALAELPSRLMPAWTKGWVVSRVRHRDFRVWPEQREFLEGEPMPSDVCNAYMSEAEGLPIAALFKTMIEQM